MAEIQEQCRQCQASFPVDDRDQAFYEKMKVPAPTLCPECRLQRPLASGSAGLANSYSLTYNGQ